MSSLPSHGISRRRFVLGVAASGLALPAARSASRSENLFVQTVLGRVDAATLGFALPHEHVICDFIGAEQTGRHRWDVAAVVERMQPLLEQLKARSIRTLVDCTPAYIGRDPRILKRLAERTGLHILTNTGYYGGAGDKFVPRHAFEETAEQLAKRWLREWTDGIEDTGVKPGFIKIGVDEIEGGSATLSPIDAKLVRAAAFVSAQTDLAVVCHTGGGAAGLAATRLFIQEKAKPARFIVAHSDKHGLPINRQVAELGAWVSLDAISRQPVDEHLALLESLIPQHLRQILLSQDNGWYSVGQPNGGEIRDFNYIPDTFLPACRQRGMTDEVLGQLTVANPARAFSLRG